MDRVDAYLLDILAAAHKIVRITRGLSFDLFLNHELVIDSVIRQIELIGEAARGVPESFQERHSDVPWHKMMGMRNRLIHNYRDIDFAVVWEVVQQNIPELIRLIAPLVPPDHEDPIP